MELIVIDENKLKIMLTSCDMRHYELRTERMSGADADTRRAFRHIFSDARDKIGFDTAGERLLVQLYTSRDGGCEIFVTKLGAEEGETVFDTMHDPEETLLSRLRQTNAEPDLTSEHCIWRFEDLPALSAACRRLKSVGYIEASALAYTTQNGRDTWYLTLALPVPISLTYAFLAEYASPVASPETLTMYLSEHGTIVTESDAVEKMSIL